MLISLCIILLLGVGASELFKKIRLPGLLGMLFLGVLTGPYMLNWIEPETLNISGDLRKIALIIILLRAGMGIRKEDLKEVGQTALKLSTIPGIFEGLTIALLSTKLFGFSFIEGGILGFIVAAVSPAVIVPHMLEFLEKRIGTNKKIPTLILASASIDDVFAITLFTTFLGLYAGTNVSLGIQILSIPLSIILGIVLGLIVGVLMLQLFKRYKVRDTKKVLLVLGGAILLTLVETSLKSKIEIASLLGVMAIGYIILEKKSDLAEILAKKYNKIWVLAEIILFVLVGAEVNINVALEAGFKGIIIIFIGIIGRSIGVIISTLGSNLNWKERLFCIIAYTPKATVQAAIGAIPLSMGIASGDVILAIAVLSIIIMAPLGAIGIKFSAKKLLQTS